MVRRILSLVLAVALVVPAVEAQTYVPDNPDLTKMTTRAGRGKLRRLLYRNTANSTALTNPQAFTAFDTTYSLPANALVNPDETIIVEAEGVFTTGATASAGWQIGLTLGSRVLQVAPSSVASSLTAQPWQFRAEVSPRVMGASGTITANAEQMFTNANGGATPSVGITVTNGTPTVDWTAANTIGLVALSANSDASNTITITQLRVYIEE